MIKYCLLCDRDHTFEAWFRSGDDFGAQKKREILSCPVCGSSKIEKALMAPNIGVKGNRASVRDGVPAVTSQPELAGAATGLPAEVQQHVVKLARELREHVTQNADNVGENFAEEARKIHYEEVEPRGIYGKATPEEASELKDEGIEVHPLPVLPEERN